MNSELTEGQTSSVQPSSELPHLHYVGLDRRRPIGPCVISREDLVRLFGELHKLGVEAINQHLATLSRPPEQSEEAWQGLLREARRTHSLTVMVIGSQGEQLAGHSAEVFNEDAFPTRVASVLFDSAFAMQQLNVTLPNRFRVSLDFSESPGFHAYDPWQTPTPNVSSIEVSGTDTTWVNGAFEKISQYFTERRTSRAWLHKRPTYNLLHWLWGFPVSIWVGTQIDGVLRNRFNFPQALQVAADIYVVVLCLVTFRGLVFCLRWLFPVIELKGSRSQVARIGITALLSTLTIEISAAMIYDMIFGSGR